jgi:SAM-dependent methyltransferase
MRIARDRQKISTRFWLLFACSIVLHAIAVARPSLSAQTDAMTVQSSPADIIATYDRVAADYQSQRNRSLVEKPILDRMLGVTPRNLSPRRLLDLGCGPGAPIATYLAERGMAITGVDGAAAMVNLFAQTLPNATAVHADMRTLDLGETFDAILAWDSFFHLSPHDQRAMFAVFQAHAAPKASLMFTSGHIAGEVWGHAAGAPVYHSSLDPDDYRDLLTAHGFKVIEYRPEDPTCDFHTIWLARYTG